MGKIANWIYSKLIRDEFIVKEVSRRLRDASASSSSNNVIFGLVKRLGLRNGDSTSTDFEEPDVDLSEIATAYDSDSYIRQGVDKYVDQLFKEGYEMFGNNEQTVEYIKLRFRYMAEATGIPTGQLLVDIGDDVVKYSNAIVVKSRSAEAECFPPGVTITGVGDMDPVAGYYCLNPSTFKVKRDKNGTVKGWQQETEGSDKTVKFKPEDVVHFYYKRAKGNAFGTPFLLPVIPDVKALRQAEENVLKMMYRNIHPFYHFAVGDSAAAGTPTEIDSVGAAIEDMDVEGGLLTTNRVVVKPIASNQVIDAAPYLSYLEQRVFSGMGIPAIMFGRGNTANRSTGDNMQSEMADRIKAIQKTIEMFFNSFIISELLREGGYDPILQPENNVEFRFKENNLDSMIKSEVHALYLYEHNAIDEDEMRTLIGRDPITDRSKMHQTLITQANAMATAQASNSSSSSGKDDGNGNKETNNKNKPQNQHGTKTSPKKETNSLNTYKGIVIDMIDKIEENYYRAYQSTNDVHKGVGAVDYELRHFSDALVSLREELGLEFEDSYKKYLDYRINYIIRNLTNSSIESFENNEMIVSTALNILRSDVLNI